MENTDKTKETTNENESLENTKKKSLLIKDKKERTRSQISEDTIKNIFYNILFAIFIMIYLFILNFAYTKMFLSKLEKDIQVFAGIFMFIAILWLERAYKNDSAKKLLTAIEFLVLSGHSLSITYIIKKYNFDFQIYLTASSYIFAIYYTFKSIIIYVRDRKRFLDSLSDVKEIVKKDEPIKKEAVKRERVETIVEDLPIQDNKDIIKETKKTTRRKKNSSNTVTKTQRTKKATKTESAKTKSEKVSVPKTKKASKTELENDNEENLELEKTKAKNKTKSGRTTKSTTTAKKTKKKIEKPEDENKVTKTRARKEPTKKETNKKTPTKKTAKNKKEEKEEIKDD